MIPYILYVSLMLTGFLIFYKLLLQKETFFNLNRAVLLSCMLLAFTLPLLPVPQQFSFRKAPASISIAAAEQQAFQTAQNAAAGAQVKPVAAEQDQIKKNFNTRQVMQWLIYLYWFGVVIFGCNFLMQAVLLLYTAYSRPVIKDGRFRIVEISGDKAPCSFANNIFINPEKYDWETYNQVLLHEKIHIEQKHTLDLLLAEIVLVFQWFNPFAWQWRKELESNLEFVTDYQMLQQDAVEKESYQMSLLKVAAPHFPLSLTTNYNQSLLKKRLAMMNAKKSNMHTTWKYFFLLPLMVLFVSLFNEPVAKGQSTASKTKTKDQHNLSGHLKTEGTWFATIKIDKVNILFRNDDEGDNSSSNTTFKLSEFENLPKDGQGTFKLTREAGTMEFTGRFDGDKGMGKYRFLPDQNYSAAMLQNGIDVSKDNDMLVYFIVNINRAYVKMLKQNGYTDLNRDKLIPLAAMDINEAYIGSIKKAGFADISLDNLIPFKALNIDKAYIDEIRKAGYKEVSPDKIISLKAQGIDGKFIEDYRKASKDKEQGNDKDAAAAERQENKNNDKDVREKRKAGDDDDDDMIAMKALQIDPAYINSFKAIGYSNIDNGELIAMKALGVTPEYVQSFLKAGFKDIKPEDFVGMKSQNVTVELVKEYNDLGIGQVSIEDVIGAKATGTTPAYIKSMKSSGHNKNNLGDYIALKTIVGF